MNTKPALFLFFITIGVARAQNRDMAVDHNFPDSVTIRVHRSYNKVNGMHRWLFGENYRKEWAEAVKLPAIRVSRLYGGLRPDKLGGGMETKSIRMTDSTGKQWVIRSVEKIPDKLLPENLRQTFVLDWVDDEYSGQHPYSALIVPALAEAVRVPHANPVIGVLEADPVMGSFSKDFAGKVVLLEEREPAGPSENTFKMMRALNAGINIRIDKEELLRARLLDLLIGDWDRHEDQWRWAPRKEGKDITYVAVPRDRDQVFHVTEGLFPSIAQLPWFDPILDNFDGQIPHVKYSLFKTAFIQPYPDAQFSHEAWTKVIDDFVVAENDSVLEAGLQRLPAALYRVRHAILLRKLKARRDHIPAAMEEYYRFINKIVDLRLSNQDENVNISDGPGRSLHIVVTKNNERKAEGKVLLDMNYLPEFTSEVRLYLMAGNDRISINTSNTPVRLRIVDSTGKKEYDIKHSGQPIRVYGDEGFAVFKGDVSNLKTHISNDTLNTRFLPTNHYNTWMPLATGAINQDDGFLLGLGFRYTGREGFRKRPFSTVQEVMVVHSFETDAFRVNYSGQWTETFGKADLTVKALAAAPDNTINFFGQGNGTRLDKSGDFHRYYRTRFDYYRVDPALRWHLGKYTSISAGPSLQFYHLDRADNTGRSILQNGLIKSYDSTTVQKDRLHLGLALSLSSDTRNSPVLPTGGYNLVLNLEGYTGVNNSSRSYLQFKPEFTYYQKVDDQAVLILSDRIGGGVTIGHPAFYQSLFLGGQGNLLGYLQNRFAGSQMIFNNLQARVKLANLGGYVLPGQLGISGFFDTGRVWTRGEHADKWHQGTGGGLYFAPASLTVIQVLAGHSEEGWYPYISFNFRI